MKKKIRDIRIFLIIFFLAGAIGLSINATRSIFLPLIPYSLMIGYLFLILFHEGKITLRHALVFSGIAVSGFGLEALGVHTGLLFGNYAYGATLGLKAWDVPLIISTNWLMLVYCTYLVVNSINVHPLLKPTIGAILMTAYDWLMEPVAIALDMWNWAGGTVPFQNYLAWFLISFVFLSGVQLARLKYINPVARDILVIQAGFFALMDIISIFQK